MASTPDGHPDSIPGGPANDPERVSPDGDAGRESVEEPAPDSPGSAGGTTGTGGTNHPQDHDVTS